MRVRTRLWVLVLAIGCGLAASAAKPDLVHAVRKLRLQTAPSSWFCVREREYHANPYADLMLLDELRLLLSNS